MIAKVGLPEETEVLYRAPKKETLQAQASAGGYVPCSNCNATGYRGRNAMFELIEMTAAMRKLVASGPTVEQIQALARKEGMPSLQQDGLRLVAAGKTSLEELQRVFKTG
jgi:type IV pilus assembly protein PilB